MVDISDILNRNSTLSFIDTFVEQDEPRDYLGMSSIGDDCERRLWLQYHKGIRPKISPRLKRIFEMGKYIEEKVKDDLVQAGIMVESEQVEFLDFDGKFKGHCDGIVTGLKESKQPHLLEIKSAGDKSFKKFKEKGVQNHSAYGSKYWAQIQCYMGYAKLKNGVFIIENKNTSERCMERVKFDKDIFARVKEKAHRIITSTQPPKGISNRPDWYKCRYCHLNNNTACRKQWEGEAPF